MENKNKYDAIIIGFGKGGKTLAATLGAAGKNVALIEQSSKMYGGTCINVGCIPTKYLVRTAGESALAGGSFAERAARYAKAIEGKDILTGNLRGKNFAKVDQVPSACVITGKAKLLSPHDVQVETADGTLSLEGEMIFLNTGAAPFVPPIEGLKDNPYIYTSETLMELKELPKELVIIGGGYIGVEYSSIYADFGSKVTILQDGETFLPREDAEIASEVLKALNAKGIQVLTGVGVKKIEKADGRAAVVIQDGQKMRTLNADAVLVATGRRPNTADLGLETAGVELNKRGGVVTDDSLMTTASNIYAMGDVRGDLQFTYLSLDDFRIVRSKLMGDGSYTLKERGAVPYSVYLTPPFARVGMSEQEAVAKGYQVKVGRIVVATIPRAQVTGQTTGLLKAVVDEKTGQILGAHLFCEGAHEMINLVKLAMDTRQPYTVLRDMVYTHPTMSESFNDLFNI